MRRLSTILVAITAASVVGCAENSAFGRLGSDLMASTGLVTHSQADSMLKAGGKLAKAADSLTDEQEYYLGRAVSAVVFSKYKPVQNAALISYVNKVGMVVAATSERPETFGGYHFTILDTEEVNALSAPGGFVFVTKGFLRLIPNEDALAAILAHEVAHVVKGHGVKAISQANLTEALMIVGKEVAASQGGAEMQALTEAFGDSVNDVANTLLTKGYSRSQEYDSDQYAAELLGRAGYNSHALVTMLNALNGASKSGNSGGWFETHPAPDDRIEEVEAEAKNSSSPAAEQVRTLRYRAALGLNS
jgi:predicted Zn-dependent protease